MRKVKSLLLYILLMYLFSCGSFHEGIYIGDHMKSPKTFQELPLAVQKMYLLELDASKTFYSRAIINLDSNKVKMRHENLDTHGMWPSKQRFTIGKHKFILPWNGNKEISPFILYNESIFYVRTMKTIRREDEIKSADYGVINLKRYLNY